MAATEDEVTKGDISGWSWRWETSPFFTMAKGAKLKMAIINLTHRTDAVLSSFQNFDVNDLMGPQNKAIILIEMSAPGI